MTTHFIHFFAPINQVTCDQTKNFCLQALQQGATELRFHFSSPGGDTLAGFTLFNFLKSLPVPVVMHNMGNIESMAVIVFLAGSRRFACPHSRFILHALHWGFNSGTVDHSRLREYVASLDNDLERYVQIFNESTQGAAEPLDIRQCLTTQERVLTAAESEATGITHGSAAAVIPEGAVTWWVSTV